MKTTTKTKAGPAVRRPCHAVSAEGPRTVRKCCRPPHRCGMIPRMGLPTRWAHRAGTRELGGMIGRTRPRHGRWSGPSCPCWSGCTGKRNHGLGTRETRSLCTGDSWRLIGTAAASRSRVPGRTCRPCYAPASTGVPRAASKLWTWRQIPVPPSSRGFDDIVYSIFMYIR